jgi:uncharacterized protein
MIYTIMDKVIDFQIPVDDLERAKKFYGTVFGWKLQDIPGVNYTVAYTVEMDENNTPKELGAINGGMMKRVGGFKLPSITIQVDNIDNTIKKIVKEGGKVVKGKENVMDMAYIAYVEDTEGNISALWQLTKK